MNVNNASRQAYLAHRTFDHEQNTKISPNDQTVVPTVRCQRQEKVSHLEKTANALNPYLVPYSAREIFVNGVMNGMAGAVAFSVGGLAGVAVVAAYIGLGLTLTLSSSDPFRRIK